METAKIRCYFLETSVNRNERVMGRCSFFFPLLLDGRAVGWS